MQVAITIDRETVLTEPGIMTGFQIKQIAHPPITDDHDLFVKAITGPDTRLDDDVRVLVAGGMAFFSAPKYING